MVTWRTPTYYSKVSARCKVTISWDFEISAYLSHYLKLNVLFPTYTWLEGLYVNISRIFELTREVGSKWMTSRGIKLLFLHAPHCMHPYLQKPWLHFSKKYSSNKLIWIQLRFELLTFVVFKLYLWVNIINSVFINSKIKTIFEISIFFNKNGKKGIDCIEFKIFTILPI